MITDLVSNLVFAPNSFINVIDLSPSDILDSKRAKSLLWLRILD